MNRPCPDSVVPNHGVEPRASTAAGSRRRSAVPLRRSASATCRPVDRWVGTPNASSAPAPTAQPIETARSGRRAPRARDDAEADDRADEAPGDVAPPATDVGADDDRERRRGRRRRRNRGTPTPTIQVSPSAPRRARRDGATRGPARDPRRERGATLPATAATSRPIGRRTTRNATASTIGYRTATNCEIPIEEALERIGQVVEEASRGRSRSRRARSCRRARGTGRPGRRTPRPRAKARRRATARWSAR